MYIAYDIESTSLVPHPNNVLTASFILDNGGELEALPRLNLLFLHTPENVSDVAAAMNAHLFVARAMHEKRLPNFQGLGIPQPTIYRGQEVFDKYQPVNNWGTAKGLLQAFMIKYGLYKPTLAGKNVASFDYMFMPEDVKALFNYQFLDPGSMYYRPGDKNPPGQAKCLERAGIENNIVTHDAFDDALQVVQLIRKFGEAK